MCFWNPEVNVLVPKLCLSSLHRTMLLHLWTDNNCSCNKYNGQFSGSLALNNLGWVNNCEMDVGIWPPLDFCILVRRYINFVRNFFRSRFDLQKLHLKKQNRISRKKTTSMEIIENLCPSSPHNYKTNCNKISSIWVMVQLFMEVFGHFYTLFPKMAQNDQQLLNI